MPEVVNEVITDKITAKVLSDVEIIGYAVRYCKPMPSSHYAYQRRLAESQENNNDPVKRMLIMRATSNQGIVARASAVAALYEICRATATR